MKRRIKLVIFISCFLMISTSAVASAAIIEEPTYGTKAVNYSSASASISFSDGTATCPGKIRGIAGKTTKTSVHLYLQKYVNGNWINVADWTSSGNTVNRVLTKTKSVSKGYKYRSKAVCYAYIGSSSEKVTKYSSAVNY